LNGSNDSGTTSSGGSLSCLEWGSQANIRSAPTLGKPDLFAVRGRKALAAQPFTPRRWQAGADWDTVGAVRCSCRTSRKRNGRVCCPNRTCC